MNKFTFPSLQINDRIILNRVVMNLQLILANKEILMAKNDPDLGEPIQIEGLKGEHFGFNLRNGLCSNANLWELYDVGIPEIPTPLGSLPLILYIAHRFINTYYNKEHPIRSSNSPRYLSYPIYGDVRHEKWLNPIRWEYTQFCLDELTYLRKTGALRE